MSRVLELGVLVSGSGSNLQAILDAVAEGRLDAHVRVVVSNKANVLALERAARAGVPTVVVPHREFSTREAFDQKLVDVLTRAGVEHVVLAGFMRVLTPVFLRAFAGKVINIHPSLLPAFPGVRAQAQALEHGVKVTGCTVHFVDEGVDTGPIIAQRAVPVLDGDTVETLTQRILEQEHVLMVEALSRVSAGLT
ncbi:MAG: phosphoribosylglycinamide formyltransferase [Polyangiaceae bacterium]|nr:phosphoribosylglycinamide formyltransferase [Polyangiaceae bacterium]